MLLDAQAEPEQPQPQQPQPQQPQPEQPQPEPAELAEQQPQRSKQSRPKRSRKKTTAQQPATEAQGQPQDEPSQPADPSVNPEHIRANVANEITQIKRKVEKQLAELVEDGASDAQPARRSRDTAQADADEPENTPAAEDSSQLPSQPQDTAPTHAADRTADQDAADNSAQQDETAADDSQPQPRAGRAPRRRRATTRGRRGSSRGKGHEAALAPDATIESGQPEQPAASREPEEPAASSAAASAVSPADAEPKAEPAHQAKEEQDTDAHAEPDQEAAAAPIEEPKGIAGSTRIEAQRRRRAELREQGQHRQHIVSQAEFLARRESVERTMVVRDRRREDDSATITQVGVLEDGMLVEHFVTSDSHPSIIGNIYLGRVQNVLPSMEAAFIDIGTGRNGVLYAGEVDWRAADLRGRSRRIEQALKSGDQVIVQVTKDPLGHKGARLTTQISLAGRYLVYVPGGRSAGISRKLPVPERKRLKDILATVVPEDGGAIIRTAAEGVSQEAIAADVTRLHELWEDIDRRAQAEKSSKGATPVTLYEEPPLLVKVVRDLFNEDFSRLVVDGRKSHNTVRAYVESMAPELAPRVERYERDQHDGQDAFAHFRIDEQIHKALSRTVWLPSGGTLVIDRTEAMTVIDVNTGKFTGSGGNLEETVTKNNLEAAEEIVRQMRLRDLGGMIVVDFVDMVLPENQELVLRRLKEALGRDRTRHQVSEVTSLGLVQMTRKRLGTGLLETFASTCRCCGGRGVIVHDEPVEAGQDSPPPRSRRTEERPAAARSHKPHKVGQRPAVQEDEDLAALLDNVVRPDAEPQRGYEEALAEFEASPRRKRRTRGNSRSDHAPRREDFVPPAEPEAEAEPKAASAAQSRRERRRMSARLASAAAHSAAPEPSQAAESSTTARRRRRRVVRRTTSDAPAAEAPRSSAPAAEEPSVVRSSRGRRRVTRRAGGSGRNTH